MKQLSFENAWRLAVSFLLLLCVMVQGCVTTPSRCVQEQAPVITQAAIDRVYEDLKREFPMIEWEKPEEVFYQYVLPDGYHRGVGWFWHGNKRVHAYVIGTGHLVFTDGYFDDIAEHEAVHLIANGSGEKAFQASQTHAAWLFERGGFVEW